MKVIFIFKLYICHINNMEKKPVTFRIDPGVIKRLKYLALDHDKTLTKLFLEAIKDLIKKYEKQIEE